MAASPPGIGWIPVQSIKPNKIDNIMKTQLLCIILSSAMLVSCSNSPRARDGTVIGALGGAGIGGIIGSQSGRGLEGAALGAGLGALGGNLIGGSQDRSRYSDRYDRRYNGRNYSSNRRRY